jgi:ABC-type multidrug transport system fused ATPase/permease subunit
LAASTEYRSTHKEGYLQQLIGEYCMRFELAAQQLTQLIVAACMLSVFAVAALLTSPLFAFGAILSMLITAVLLRPFGARARQNATEHEIINREVVRRVGQTMRLADEITAFDVGSRVADELSHDIRRASEYLRRLRTEARLIPALSQYSLIGTVLLLIAALSVLSSSTVLRDIAPLILIMVRAIGYVRQSVTASRSGIQLIPYLDLLQAELVSLGANEAYRGEKSPRSFAGLDLRGVGFEYKPGQPVLAGVNLSVRPGEVVGLIGPSGSGKTTLSQLIIRLRTPTAGSITTGGISLMDVSPAAWSRISAYLPQDTKIVLASAADNIRFFRDGYDGGHVETAARAAHIHDELEALPQGYDTLIGPGERSLSGGQRQRLAIARALLAEPQLLVLDEPTSALDARSERLISRTLEELRGTIAVVLIAHRPAPLAVCDRVFRVTAGSVQEIDPVSATAS